LRAGVITCQLIHGGSAFVLAKNVQKTVNISSKTLKCLVTKTAEFSAQFFTCEEDRHRVRQDCNLNSLFFFFSQFFWINILLGFLGFIFKVHKLSSKFDFFFRCCSILDLIHDILDYIAVDIGSVHIHFDTSFYYTNEIFWQHLFFKYISHYRLSSKQHFSWFCLFLIIKSKNQKRQISKYPWNTFSSQNSLFHVIVIVFLGYKGDTIIS